MPSHGHSQHCHCLLETENGPGIEVEGMGIRSGGGDVAAFHWERPLEFEEALILAQVDEVYATLSADVANALEDDLAASYSAAFPPGVSHVSDYQIAASVTRKQSCPAEIKVHPLEVTYFVTHEGALPLKCLGIALETAIDVHQNHPSLLKTSLLPLEIAVASGLFLVFWAPPIQVP
jgi:hypothetical protein